MNILHRHIFGFKVSKTAWLETIAVAAIAIFIWFLSENKTADDPTQSIFLWSILGPIIVAMRYGFAKGFACALLTVVGCLGITQISVNPLHFSISDAIGMCLCAMVAGEFHDLWYKTNQNYRKNHDYMAKKLNSFTQNYHLLKVSHDQLEQKTASETVNLRSTMQALQMIAAKHKDHELSYLAAPFLDIFSEIGGIEVAGIYQIKNDIMHNKAESTLGDKHSFDPLDPMLQDMLSTKRLLSVAKFTSQQQHQSRYQLCIPFEDTSGELQAAILVEKTKFFMLTKLNVALMSVLANYAADLISSKAITPCLEPSQGQLFMQYLMRARDNREQFGTDSSVVICIDRTGKHKTALDHAVNYRRGADIYWNCWHKNSSAGSIPAMAVLLPLTELLDGQQYVLRLQEILSTEIGQQYKDIEIIGPLSLNTHQGAIERLLAELGAPSEDTVDYSVHN
jgi:hypothetical protein